MISLVRRVDYDQLGAQGHLAKVIEAAMADSRPVTFFYGGFRRDVCPHVVAIGKKGLYFKGYQYAGGSSQGEIKSAEEGGWRRFELSKSERLFRLPSGAWYPPADGITIAKTEADPEALSFYKYPSAP